MKKVPVPNVPMIPAPFLKALMSKNKKKNSKDNDIAKILSEAANSMGQLVHAVVDEKVSASNAGQKPADDYWLFCKRLYLKLRNLPEGTV